MSSLISLSPLPLHLSLRWFDNKYCNLKTEILFLKFYVLYPTGKAADDTVKLSACGLKPGFKIMMMGSLEEDITSASTAPENMDDVVNDLDLTEEEIALENREEYLSKVCQHSFQYFIHRLMVLNSSLFLDCKESQHL